MIERKTDCNNLSLINFLLTDISRQSLTRPAPALIVSTIFILDVETPRADFIMDLVVAVYFDMRIHNGHHLEKEKQIHI